MKNLNFIKLYITIVAIVLLAMAIAHKCHAQSNQATEYRTDGYYVITNGENYFVPNLPAPPDSTAQDIAKVFSDFGIDIPVGQIGGWLFVIYFAAKIARNKTPLGNGTIGNILSSVVNAEQKTLPPKP